MDCDAIARNSARKGNWGYKRIVAAYGDAILREDGEIDRAKLGAVVFKDPTARKKLNQAAHPPVLVQVWLRILGYWLSLTRVVVVDMPLLFETGSDRYMHENVLVHCPEHVQVARVVARDGLSEADALSRIRAQMPLEAKLGRATRDVENAGTKEEFEARVRDLARELRGRESWGWTLLWSPYVLLAMALRLGDLRRGFAWLAQTLRVR